MRSVRQAALALFGSAAFRWRLVTAVFSDERRLRHGSGACRAEVGRAVASNHPCI
jgi:hypothetical protein